MKERATAGILFLIVFGVFFLAGTSNVSANGEFYYSSVSRAGHCDSCHGTTSTCSGCHNMGTHSGLWATQINVTGTPAKKLYLPGETVSIKITGGDNSGWARVLLFDENMAELGRSTGAIKPGYTAPCCGPAYGPYNPVTLTSSAPLEPGTYTWNVAWYGNKYDLTEAGYLGYPNNFGPRWTPDPNNPNHGMEVAYAKSFTVTTDLIPMINVTPASLAFGNISIGNSSNLNARIENIGTGSLNITGIAPCSGTSGEFAWSPAAPFSVAASQNLSVTYMPTAAGTDSGCITITSDDATKPAMNINLSGTGQEALDVDITKLTVASSVSLKRKQSITPTLSVFTSGTRWGYVNATVIGVQNGVQVYNQSLTVYDPSGDTLATAHSLPAYTPTAQGVITWTATIIDENPDNDSTTASTTVGR